VGGGYGGNGAGGNGGSGGGAGNAVANGGTATSGQGNVGGNGVISTYLTSGGGGGAGAAGDNGNGSTGQNGAGGIGLNVIQAASLVSAYPIIALDIFDNRLELAKEMGASHIINTKGLSFEEISIKINEISKIDAFIDNTGNPQVIEFGYNIIKPQGKVVLVGVPKKGNNINIFSLPLHFGKSITGSHGGESNPQIDIPRYFELYKNGRLQLKNLLTKTYTLEQVNEAIADMRDGKLSGRCLIKF
jgi:Zn-dependent alcohol dehydrogenase